MSSRPRSLHVIATLVAAFAACWSTPATASPRSVGFAAATSGLPAPTVAPVWIRHQRTIRAGSTARFVLDPLTATRCRISLSGPRGRHGSALGIRGDGRLAQFTVRTRRNARPGNWRLTARCAQPSGSDLSAQATVAVRATRRAGRGMLAGRGDIRVRRISPYGDDGPAGRTSGRGGAANPFDATQCTSLAYDRRADVYDRAVAAGVPAGGLVSRPAFSEDYVWNGKRWAENARRAGIPTGARPAVGALFVGTIGRYGHVAYVEQGFADGSYVISERNRAVRARRRR